MEVGDNENIVEDETYGCDYPDHDDDNVELEDDMESGDDGDNVELEDDMESGDDDDIVEDDTDEGGDDQVTTCPGKYSHHH